MFLLGPVSYMLYCPHFIGEKTETQESSSSFPSFGWHGHGEPRLDCACLGSLWIGCVAFQQGRVCTFSVFNNCCCSTAPSWHTKLIMEPHLHPKRIWGTSLVAQWSGTRLPMQGTRVRALVQEDPTCRGATKPVCHSCWACALEHTSHNYWSPHA